MQYFPLIYGDTFQDPPWMCKTVDISKPHICICAIFFLYIHSYDEV